MLKINEQFWHSSASTEFSLQCLRIQQYYGLVVGYIVSSGLRKKEIVLCFQWMPVLVSYMVKRLIYPKNIVL